MVFFRLRGPNGREIFFKNPLLPFYVRWFVSEWGDPTTNVVFTDDPPVFLVKELTIRIAQLNADERAGEVVVREHYLGDVPEGRQWPPTVAYRRVWVALLDWGRPAGNYPTGDRIGWTHRQRAERLNLAALNRRVLVLSKTRMAILVAKALALALLTLPKHWQQPGAYRLALASNGRERVAKPPRGLPAA